MSAKKSETFGLIKTLVDAHTMGVHAAAALLRDCGYKVMISPKSVEYAMERITSESSQKVILDWINDNHIERIGFSYRLDPDTAVELMGRLIYLLTSKGYYSCLRKDRKGIRGKSICIQRWRISRGNTSGNGCPVRGYPQNYQGRLSI